MNESRAYDASPLETSLPDPLQQHIQASVSSSMKRGHHYLPLQVVMLIEEDNAWRASMGNARKWSSYDYPLFAPYRQLCPL